MKSILLGFLMTLAVIQNPPPAGTGIAWLPPGDYYIGVTPPQSVAVLPGSPDNWVRTFYPGAVEPARAVMQLDWIRAE